MRGIQTQNITFYMGSLMNQVIVPDSTKVITDQVKGSHGGF